MNEQSRSPKGEAASRQRAAHQLPPGRHGLSRSFVEANQRQRILDAVADVVSLAGYQSMSVEDVVGAAGVSRRTFYDNFKSKEDAFLTAYDEIGSRLVLTVKAAYDASETFPEGVVACLRAFLEFVASVPHYADMCIVEVLAAGPPALARRNAVMNAMAELLQQGAATMKDGIRPPQLTAETIVGGIYEVVYSRVLQGKTAELPSLLADLAYSMMLPYVGHAAAERMVAPLREPGSIPSALDAGDSQGAAAGAEQAESTPLAIAGEA
jgi:AcrR family transcriptional regulator